MLSSVYLGILIVQKLYQEEDSRIDEVRLTLDPDADVEGDEIDVLSDLEVLDKEEFEEELKELSEKLHEGEGEILNISEDKAQKLTKRQNQILDLVREYDKIDTDLLKSEIKGVSVRTLRRDLDKLVNMKILEKIGKTRGVYYVVNVN